MKNLPKGILPLLILVIGVLGAVAMVKLKPSAPKRPTVPHQTVVTVHRVGGETPTAAVTRIMKTKLAGPLLPLNTRSLNQAQRRVPGIPAHS